MFNIMFNICSIHVQYNVQYMFNICSIEPFHVSGFCEPISQPITNPLAEHGLRELRSKGTREFQWTI